MNLQTLLDSLHTPHSMPLPDVDEATAHAASKAAGRTAPLTIKAISSHGIKVATPNGDEMIVPWNVMRSLALEGEPYASLLTEAQETMLKRLKGRRRGMKAAPISPMPQRRSTDPRTPVDGNQTDLSLTVSKDDSPAKASKATKTEVNKTSPPQTVTLVLNDMPKDLVAKAREKGKSLMPPISVKWAVRLLLEDWVRDGKQR